jgi:murein DD-endopeptidase MepM/ murein hydrolase activator NlpD
MSDPYNPPRPFNRTSRYGERINPVTGKSKFHAGEDWAAPEGTPIPAATPGKVIYSGFNPGFGNTVIVQTTNGHSLYVHMNEAPKVGVGQQVWPGDIIGDVGSTGTFSRGNHLHYSTITSGTPNAQGEIGFNVDKKHTTDPALFDTAIRYPNQTLQASRAMFGPNDTSDALAFGNRRSPHDGCISIPSIRIASRQWPNIRRPFGKLDIAFFGKRSLCSGGAARATCLDQR